jgi:hypothetical protein
MDPNSLSFKQYIQGHVLLSIGAPMHHTLDPNSLSYAQNLKLLKVRALEFHRINIVIYRI